MMSGRDKGCKELKEGKEDASKDPQGLVGGMA